MNTNMIISLLNKKHDGTWFLIHYASDLPLSAAAIKDGHYGYKVTMAQVRKGIDYSNLQSVKDKTPEGFSGSRELPWGNWKSGFEGLVIEHKGIDYIRLYFGPNKTRNRYFLDGKEVTFEEVQNSGLVTAKFSRSNERPDCITIKAQNIQTIL